MTDNQEPVSIHFHEVNERSPIPYYLQVIEALENALEQGVWKPNERMPSEAELCETFNVSRTVIRQALSELEYTGQVVRVKGKGTFVNDEKISKDLVQNLSGFYQDMQGKGFSFHTQVLSLETENASEEIADHLEIPPGTKVFAIERLRFVEGRPILVVKNYIPYDYCRELENADLSNQSLYKLLEDMCGQFISRGWRTIEAAAADERLARLLDYELGGALVLVESVTLTEEEKPIEYFISYHRGDRVRFEVELYR